ncbi:AbrB/MazE/SpoVT family DNA-binding domain-containing protein [Candidatus Woesearchaeota archaeon]|jgi:AbrB family looped-hinge helix DNA binding protein|nr:AbrB/MazE/SpoVT family DNA-binding domain-containing protein [Candidatus Woesearchaeota archaeon]
MEIGLTKMSSKGQIVIPVEMRKGLKEGDQIMLMKSKDKIVLKKATAKDLKLAEDLEFARRTEEAWKRYDKGEFIEMEYDDFLEEIKKW